MLFPKVVETRWLVSDRVICSCAKPLSYQTAESRQPPASSQTLQYCDPVLFREFETGGHASGFFISYDSALQSTKVKRKSI